MAGKKGMGLGREHDEKVRAKIRDSLMVNRLISFVNGEIEMVPHQVTAALGLLKKIIPDLSQIQGDADQPLKHEVTVSWKSKSTMSQEALSSLTTNEPSDSPS